MQFITPLSAGSLLGGCRQVVPLQYPGMQKPSHPVRGFSCFSGGGAGVGSIPRRRANAVESASLVSVFIWFSYVILDGLDNLVAPFSMNKFSLGSGDSASKSVDEELEEDAPEMEVFDSTGRSFSFSLARIAFFI